MHSPMLLQTLQNSKYKELQLQKKQCVLLYRSTQSPVIKQAAKPEPNDIDMWKVNWNVETSWPLSRDFEALKTVLKEFLKNSFSFSRYRLLNSRNSVGQILCFHRFPKKYCRAISVCDVTDDLCSLCEADVRTGPRSLFPRSRAPR